jgi:aldehyde dehydrogenase
MNAMLVQDVVSEVMRRLQSTSPATRPIDPMKSATPGGLGIYTNVDDAVRAANAAQEQLARSGTDVRDGIVKLIKKIAVDNADAWGRLEFAETKIGRLEHKIEKLHMMAGLPGVEFLKTTAYSGTNGIGLDEYAPFGTIGCITPVTHSIPTLTCNAINMIAAGNSLVINPHPAGANCAAVAVRTYNEAIARQFGIDQLITILVPPTLETADAIFNHRGVHMIVVTGGPAVARAAMKSSKRAVVAGPGNPPVVVDETACLTNAAKSIIRGAAYDNNLLCIGEKQVFVVNSVFDKLVSEMTRNGAAMLNASQVDALTRVALPVDPKDGKPHVHKDYVGKDASVLAHAAGANVPADTLLLIGETSFEHPFVQVEQMMPFVPLVRCNDWKEAMDRAIASEHGFRHTAIIHSRDMDRITRFGRTAATTIFVANGPSVAGLGAGGEGFGGFSIATPTGEGIANPMTFTRFRRVALAGSLRMI